jgi:mannose/cellobiose epimerase-like protein (N-acyl-D-glucosamine 2-epimerase family)
VLDGTIDLYDNAFAVFAFSWLYRATNDAWALDWAKKTLRAIKTYWAHPSGLGFWHDETKALPRQQNPHMHLIEACLVGYQASGDGEFLETATHIAQLFGEHFFDGKTLAEYFDHNWQRMPDDSGRHIEPGHMLEWAWILGEYGRATNANTNTNQNAIIAGLIDWAEAHGVDHQSGITYNVVRDDGTPIDRGSRTWPNTERLKAAVVAHTVLQRDAAQTRAIAVQSIDVLFKRYLATDGMNKVAGGWVDHFKADGSVNAANMPTSTFYHVFLAFAEALNAKGLVE